MRKLTVSLGKSYEVLIGAGLLKNCGEKVRQVTDAEKVLIVCGETVASLYAGSVKNSLAASGFEPIIFTFPGGEACKNTDTLVKLLEFMAESAMARSDCVIALGGGVTGDIAGFAASCYMRGIDFIQMPTTLLAMVDSSVGGKCAVNLTRGKNLAGAFYQPKLVLCDTEALKTLPHDILCDGYAEITKYAMLCKPYLLSVSDCKIEELIYESLDAKRFYIEEDERDNGKRAYLNLGHTVAHAIEKASNFTISHGKAVAMGLALMSRYDDAVCSYLRKHGLPVELCYDLEELCKLMINDKKRESGRIRLVEFEALGSCSLRYRAFDELHELPARYLK